MSDQEHKKESEENQLTSQVSSAKTDDSKSELSADAESLIFTDSTQKQRPQKKRKPKKPSTGGRAGSRG